MCLINLFGFRENGWERMLLGLNSVMSFLKNEEWKLIFSGLVLMQPKLEWVRKEL